MELKEIMQRIGEIGIGNITAAVIILLSLIQIAPIKIDPWSKLFKWIGTLLTGDLMKKVTDLETNLTNRISSVEKAVATIEYKEDERDAVNKRVRILKFEDEIQTGIRHSKDSFDQVLSDISSYNQYCEAHRAFKNEQTAQTVEHIRKMYSLRLEKHDFL